MNWLVLSIIASVLLTVVLNLALRLLPGANDRATHRIEPWAAPDPSDRYDRRRVKVFLPWKAMIIGSLLLTFVVNAVIRLG